MSDAHNPTRPQRLQWRLLVFWAVLSLGFVAWGLVRMTVERTPGALAGRANLDALRPWWIASAMTWTALTAMGWMLWRGLAPVKRDGEPQVALLILVVAIAARLVVLMGHVPGLSDDVYRYVLDGRNLAHGFNPYLDTPAARAGFPDVGLLERPLAVLMDQSDAPPIVERWPGEAALLPLVNNPEMHTIYLPAAQWTFWLGGRLVRDGASDPVTGAWAMRSVMTGFEILAIVLLLVALHLRGRAAWWAALYAWHPLALSEIAGSGHQDSVGLMLMMLAFVALAAVPRRVWSWTGALALAVLVKPVVLPIAAYMLRDVSLPGGSHGGTEAWRKTEIRKQKTEVGPSDGARRSVIDHEARTIPSLRASLPPWLMLAACLRSWKAWLISLIVGAVVCTAVAGPLWFTHGGAPLENLFASSQRFATKWAHFGSVYESSLWAIRVFDPLEDPVVQWQKKERHEMLARLVCLGLIALVGAGAFFGRTDAWRSARMVFFAMVLCSTTAHPWYLLWALILAPGAMSPALWVASLTLLLGYAQLGDVVEWTTPAWAMWAAYLPVYGVLLADVAWKMTTGRVRGADAPGAVH